MATEYWMSGPVDNIPALLQPVAHALLQANLEINRLMQDFPEEKLWEKPAGLAAPGFHLQHVSGVLDRLCTYARAEALSEAQLAALKAEGTPGATLHNLLEQFDAQVHKTLLQLSATPENTLTEFRGVGRKQLPSTVLGLLFHAAEHTMRHTGQLLVTVKVLS
ncbi:DinB family protein [Chitinophaga eiseniae]|uniref:DinB family protein n=1 Tax=Chitinophaga eiseniae TaxID=634771 RepID=A0A847SDG4_9BACT|nr:DinB family protein [Chitinophaga eiseniae]NLR79841.1 DinB family protein [Chitinophaga eiseniae]